MKKIILILTLGLMASTGVLAQKAMDSFMIQVDGLGCPFCAYGLEKKFKEFKGIKNVKIDIESGDFSFNYPAEKALTIDAVITQVEKAGYTPIRTSIQRSNGEVESSEDAKVKPKAEDLTTKTVAVSGNCEQCRARIENAANRITGVATANWDVDSKILLVAFDPNYTSIETIEKSIANAGHDTHNHRAKKHVYDKLPQCCHYERVD